MLLLIVVVVVVVVIVLWVVLLLTELLLALLLQLGLLQLAALEVTLQWPVECSGHLRRGCSCSSGPALLGNFISPSELAPHSLQRKPIRSRWPRESVRPSLAQSELFCDEKYNFVSLYNSHWITHIRHERSCAVCCLHNAPYQSTALIHQVCWALTGGLQYGLLPINQLGNLKLPSNKLSGCSPPHQLCSISDGPDLRPHQVPRHIHPDLHRPPKVLMQVLRNKIINFAREENRRDVPEPDLICQQRRDDINLGPQKSQETVEGWGSQLDEISCSWVLLLLSGFSDSGVFFVLRNDHQIRLELTRLMVSSHLISSYHNLLLLLFSNSRKCAHKQDIQQQQHYLEMRNCQYKHLETVNIIMTIVRDLMTINLWAIFISIRS